jgi:hypothetical protein
LPFRAGEVQGSPLTFRISQVLLEYLSEESEEDDIMIAPSVIKSGVIKSFLAGGGI